MEASLWPYWSIAMNSLGILCTTAALMMIVAIACTTLCLVWSMPSWRRLLDLRTVVSEAPIQTVGGMRGWPARVGSGLVSAGIAVCALVAWYGCFCCYCALVAL
jgi:hypothetical protein